jgi:toxin ParE1/3/4
MGYKVVWSANAIDDVDAIASYIARDSISYAAAVVQKVISVTRNLAEVPLEGGMIREFGEPNFRQEFAYSYRIIYQVEDDLVTVVAIVPGKKLLDF